ncbi:lipid A oxidase [Frigidibacter sp. MR17.24]|uniref:lipid A oxidase n=1 Tax=Frigidibacter sp. MR17.24 TaxID=3127345 RepID=UPI003012CCB4
MRATTAALALGALLAPGVGQAEISLSFYSGLQSVDGTRLDAGSLGSSDPDWAGRSLSAPPYWGARATWWADEAWGFAVEVNHAKAYARNRAEAGYDTLEFTDGLNFATVNAFRRWQEPGRRWWPYVGAGVGLAMPHVEVTPAGGRDTFEYQITGPVVQVVAGTTLGVSARWRVFGEWKASWSKHDIDLKDGDSLQTEFTTNAVNIGITYSF